MRQQSMLLLEENSVHWFVILGHQGVVIDFSFPFDAWGNGR
jgi:hypothetical protein